MIRTLLTVAEFQAIFPVKPESILAITGRPDRVQLEPFFKALRQWAASIPSLKGGGLHGHLAFIVATVDYLLLPWANGFITQASPVF